MTDYAAHFNDLYRAETDPWDYASSAYETSKYNATLAALSRPRYMHALEAGCSIGVLSARLARRCDRLLAIDFAAVAVAQAASRLEEFPMAEARRATLPQEWPVGSYDLIVLSEILYYLTPDAIAQLARQVARDAVAGAECVLVHWQGDTETAVPANDARDMFLCALSGVRPFQAFAHPTSGEYDHRTILFSDEPAETPSDPCQEHKRGA